MHAQVNTFLPGPESKKILDKLRMMNGAYDIEHEIVFSGQGQGNHFTDVDGNTFLDFASQTASNPFGYNYPALGKIVDAYAGTFPIKYSGQDFSVSEHAWMLEELLSITPPKMDAAFLINSGAEANENSIKIAMRNKPTAKMGISFENGWHGRTTGALSLTNAKAVQVKGYPRIPVKRLPYDETAGDALEDLLKRELGAEEIGYVIVEAVQGEGGYHPANPKMMKDIRRKTRTYGIHFICDEVQCGMGRTGKWWGYQHYRVEPDIQSCGKALQVGATVASRKLFPKEGSAISSTWGGGHVMDMALGTSIIQEIKRLKLLKNVEKQGKEINKRLNEMCEMDIGMHNVRGMGLMQAFDVETPAMRKKFMQTALRNGLVIMGCGFTGIRVIPALNVNKQDVDEGMRLLEETAKQVKGRNA